MMMQNSFGGTIIKKNGRIVSRKRDGGLALIDELRKTYPRRPALQDELDKSEQKIMKARGGIGG